MENITCECTEFEPCEDCQRKANEIQEIASMLDAAFLFPESDEKAYF